MLQILYMYTKICGNYVVTSLLLALTHRATHKHTNKQTHKQTHKQKKIHKSEMISWRRHVANFVYVHKHMWELCDNIVFLALAHRGTHTHKNKHTNKHTNTQTHKHTNKHPYPIRIE